MALGLLCIIGAGGMAGRILLTERQSDMAAQTVLTELNQQIPHYTPAATAEAPRLVITDQSGMQVDWPMATQDIPMPWPVDSAGAPVATVTDAFGQTFVWQYDLNRPCIVNAEQMPSQDMPVVSADTTSAGTNAAVSADAMSTGTDAPAPSDAMSTATDSPAPTDTTSAGTNSPTPTDTTSAGTDSPAPTEAMSTGADSPAPTEAMSAGTNSPTPTEATSTATDSPAPIAPTEAMSTGAHSPASTAPPEAVSTVTDVRPSATPYPALPQTDDTLPTAAPTVSNVSSTWTQDSQGGLLPYVSNEDGQIIPWMTDTNGQAVSREMLLSLWNTLLAQMSLNLSELLDQPAFVLNPQMEMPITTLDGHEYIGIVDIPSQGLSLPIMSEWSYPKLKIAPCRFSGSVYSGDIVIAGHNSNGHFTRIKKLVIGDEVRFTDVDGNVFIYSVIGIDVVGANDVDDMLAGSDEWDLTLFTCSYSARKRTAIRCKLETYQLPEEK